MTMIFNNDDLIEIIRLSEQDDLSSRQIAAIYDCGKTTINNFLAKTTYIEFWESYDEKPIASGSIVDNIIDRTNIETITNKKRFILTSS